MKALLVILLVIALLLVAGGSLNRGTEISFDYAVGTAPAVSLFWIMLGVAAALLLAGIVGWAIGRGGAAGARGKLEKELETTYRRLRDAEARLPRAAVLPASGPADVEPPRATETRTAVLPEPLADDTVAAPGPPAGEDATAIAEAAVEDDATTIAAAEQSAEATLPGAPPPNEDQPG